jgi:uncharacterized protein with NAD-binding domain and iron-sulfur cluster
METRPTKIAIIGGGCAGLTAAFELTRPEHEGRYEVSVYQHGWRLGGKGASGRGKSGRIEEHGLHLWMGWYENAFRIIRECYRELDRDPSRYRIATWDDAFKPDPFTGAMEQAADGSWRCWRAELPRAPGSPGAPGNVSERLTVADYMVRAAALLRTLLDTLATGLNEEDGGGPDETSRQGPASTSAAASVDAVLRLAQLGTLGGLVQGLDLFTSFLRELSPESQRLLSPLLEAVATNARRQLRAIASIDEESKRLWTIMDLTFATMRGILRHNLMTHPQGFEIVDDYDCREWLLLNGASPESVDSGYLRALYDLGFAYEDGDPERPRLAAGQALRSMLRAFFTYRGAFFWKMQSAMGDIVFAPLYEVLRRRGVRFEFFHRLTNVGMSWGEAPHVKRLEFEVQARTESGAAYEPLVEVNALPCWPNQPLWDQLRHGRRLEQEAGNFEHFFAPPSDERRVLHVEADFDLVVLAIGIGAVPHVCGEIVTRDPRWRSMVDHVKTVATQAFQLWLTEDMRTLGWNDRPINVSGFVEPFDTWADMTHLIPEEGWAESPCAIAYFCNALPDLEPIPARHRTDWNAINDSRVRTNAVAFIKRDLAHLWRSAHGAAGFRWEWLADADVVSRANEPADERRFGTQFWTANVNPSDRYTLSLPGSMIYRISPLDRTYDNLTIAGDWADNGFNAGCVEAAVMSGMLAAHALSQSPALRDIVGYDHP